MMGQQMEQLMLQLNLVIKSSVYIRGMVALFQQEINDLRVPKVILLDSWMLMIAGVKIN